MTKTSNRWLCSTLAMLLALCLVFTMPMTALADTGTVCNDRPAAEATVREAITSCGYAQQIVDIITSVVIDGEYASMFNGSGTSSFLKEYAIGMIIDLLDDNEELMLQNGFEPTPENKALLAEEIYYVACIYYDEMHRDGGSRESANKLAVIETMRFVLVETKGYSDADARKTSAMYYELNEIYSTKGEEAAIQRAIFLLPSAHVFAAPTWTWAKDHSSASATLKCTICNAAPETVPATVTKAFTSGSCQTETTYTYTATAEVHSTTYTDSKTATIPGSHAFANGVCTICGIQAPSRIYGDNRYETAFKVADALKQALKVEKFNTVIVASGKEFPDALAGSYLAAQKNAPILLVNKNTMASVKDYISKNLNAGGTVYLLGGEAAVPAEMESGLDSFNVERLAGANRYETNLAILKKAGTAGQEILVCTGKGFADSLSASAANKPILLVNKVLTPAQKEFLKTSSGKFVIIGGESAVSAAVAEELKAYGTVERVGGANRYATSVLVAERFIQNPTYAVLAYAKNFPDGLCGGPLAYSLNAPLILTATGKEASAAAYTAKVGITDGVVLGGTGLISDAAASTILGK